MRVGDSLTLSATATDARGDVVPTSDIAWRSLAPTVASVDVRGVVRSLAPGHAQIVASVDGISDVVTIDVRP